MPEVSAAQTETMKTKTSVMRGRLTSLDVFRGMAIALMILVNNPGGPMYYSFLQHASWNGWTLADLVFPFFIFIMGVSIPFAFVSKLDLGTSRKRLLPRVMRRTVILFILGLFINLFTVFGNTPFRVMGVLQRIALCYLFASLVFLFLKPKWRIYLVMAIPVAYWMVMTLIPVPGYGAGVLAEDGNLAGYVDRLLLDGHLYTANWDPEGLLSTLPAVGTALIGVLAGQHLGSNAKAQAKTANLLFFGSVSLAIGFLWGFWFPINKNLWTSSYVAFTGGVSLLLLGACFFIIDAKGRIAWTKPFTMLGLNSIFVYVLSEIVNLVLIYASIPMAENTSLSLKSLIYEGLFASWAGPLHGSFIYAIAFLGFCWTVAAILYRKRIFIRV
jgi:predicted acyltransferase